MGRCILFTDNFSMTLRRIRPCRVQIRPRIFHTNIRIRSWHIVTASIDSWNTCSIEKFEVLRASDTFIFAFLQAPWKFDIDAFLVTWIQKEPRNAFFALSIEVEFSTTFAD
jgi:hypothetical protein